MYRQLLDLYFISPEYIESETNEAYLKLTESMHRYLSEEEFLDVEEKLHNVLIYMVEKAFLAGCKAVSRNNISGVSEINWSPLNKEKI